MIELFKYPRTFHIQGSRLQPGDEDLSAVPVSAIIGRYVVVEEKMDGANSAISYDESAMQLLQSRGHYLVGGASEKHFHLLKQWAAVHSECMHRALGSRYICYGEWLFAKHTIFYDLLPHFWLEFDVLDRKTGKFMSTERRAELLRGLPLSSVRVLFAGKLESAKQLHSLLGRSAYISDEHFNNLKLQARKHSLSEERVIKETDLDKNMEGLYIKIEEDGAVVERYKYVRASFLTAVVESESHWLQRPILPNVLRPGVDIYQKEDSSERC